MCGHAFELSKESFDKISNMTHTNPTPEETFQNIIDEYEEMLKTYTLALFMVDIRKDESGDFYFDVTDWSKCIAVLGGHIPEDDIIHSFQDFEFSGIDKEGEWYIKGLFKYVRGDWHESASHAEMLLTTIEGYQSFQDREDFQNIINSNELF